MLAYLKSEYEKAVKKLDAVRAQCLPYDNDMTPQQFAATEWQLKPFETMVGLWQGRVDEAEGMSDNISALAYVLSQIETEAKEVEIINA